MSAITFTAPARFVGAQPRRNPCIDPGRHILDGLEDVQLQVHAPDLSFSVRA